MTEPRTPVIHYLITIMAQGDAKPDTATIAAAISNAIHDCGLMPLTAKAYASSFPVDPTRVGLKDAWLAMGDLEREAFSLRYGELAAAITLLCN